METPPPLVLAMVKLMSTKNTINLLKSETHVVLKHACSKWVHGGCHVTRFQLFRPLSNYCTTIEQELQASEIIAQQLLNLCSIMAHI